MIHLTFFREITLAKVIKKFKMFNTVTPAVLAVKNNDSVEVRSPIHNKPRPHFRIRDENWTSSVTSCTQFYSCIKKKESDALVVHNKPLPHFRIRDENGTSIVTSCTQCNSCIKKSDDLEVHNKPRPHFRVRDENGVSIGKSCTQCYSCIKKKESEDFEVHNKPLPHFRVRDENGKSIGASCTQCYSCIMKKESADLELHDKPRPHFRIRDKNGVSIGASCTQCHSCLNLENHKAAGLDDGIYLTEPALTMPPSLITIAASVLYKNGQSNLVDYAYQKTKARKFQKRKSSIGYSDYEIEDEEPEKKKANCFLIK